MARWNDKWRVIAVSDVYKVMPWADAMYSADNLWWEHHKGAPEFRGDRWACHEDKLQTEMLAHNDKREIAERYGINLIRGHDGNEFSTDPGVIKYGSNSGFQAINLAMLFGATRIVLVGFDMRHVAGKAHFFGNHPRELQSQPDEVYRGFAKKFAQAAKTLPPKVSILNATPGSALECFPKVSLDEVLSGTDHRMPGDGTELHASAG